MEGLALERGLFVLRAGRSARGASIAVSARFSEQKIGSWTRPDAVRDGDDLELAAG